MDKAEAKKALRKALIEERLHLPDRLSRAEALQRVMRIWLFDRPDTVIGAIGPSRASSIRCPRCTAGKKMANCMVSRSAAKLACPWSTNSTKP
jgi:hypothetical protein